ncbi:MAG: uracil-xanthine permease [Clostridiales bacterium]|nr:uracil-xanthine permease [Clostridiales bacterium]
MNETKKPILGQEAVTDARTLGAPRMLILGLQHLFAMFGATVLVPILVQGYGLPLSIQTTLLMAGLGTLLFHLCTKFKVPAFLGSSFAYLGGFSTVASMPAYEGLDPELKLAYALGGIVIAGLLYLVLALLFKVLGAKTVMRYFPPIVTGPMIIMIGLNLSGSAINNAATCWWLALVAMAIIVVANIWGKGMVKIIPILLGVVGSYIVAVIATVCGAQLPDANGVMQPLVNFASVGEAHLVGLQKFIIAKFDVSAILVMAPIAIAAMMEHIGDISAISSTTGHNFIEDPGLHRTLVGDGLATAFAGFFGGPANTTYGENTGVLALSKVYDPRVIRLAAIYAIILSFSPKFDALVNSIPSAIVGGVSFILYGMISAVGVRNIVENQVDLTKSRNLIIAAVMFVSGLGFSSVGGITFTVGGAAVTLSGLAIAALCGVILNAILPGNDYVFGSSVQGDKSADLGSY